MSLTPSIFPMSTSISAFSPTYSREVGPKTHQAEYDILIYGATSFTGKIVIDYLCRHPQAQEFTIALGGRTASKLKELQGQVKQKGFGKKDIIDFKLEETEDGERAVEEAVGRCRVVMNLAGPYSSQNAEMLVRQCAKQGRHYVDLTGETPWVKEMIERYDYLASTTGSCIVPSCGFDSIPGDVVNYVSAKALVEKSGEQQNGPSGSVQDAGITKSETYYTSRGGLSGGTANSAFIMMEMDKDRLARGTGEFALSIVSSGKPSLGLRPAYYNELAGLHGSLFVMAPHNTRIVRRSWSIFQRCSALLGHAHRMDAPRMKYGDSFTYDEILMLGERGSSMSWWSSWLVGLVFTAVGAAFAGSSIFRSLIRLIAPVSGTGPSPDAQKKGWFEAINVVESDKGNIVTTMFGQGDPGYSGTARMLSEAALSLSFSHQSLPPLGQLGGVLTPVTAMGDILVERLRKYGSYEIETRSLEAWKRQRHEAKKHK